MLMQMMCLYHEQTTPPPDEDRQSYDATHIRGLMHLMNSLYASAEQFLADYNRMANSCLYREVMYGMGPRYEFVGLRAHPDARETRDHTVVPPPHPFYALSAYMCPTHEWYIERQVMDDLLTFLTNSRVVPFTRDPARRNCWIKGATGAGVNATKERQDMRFWQHMYEWLSELLHTQYGLGQLSAANSSRCALRARAM